MLICLYFSFINCASHCKEFVVGGGGSGDGDASAAFVESFFFQTLLCTV